mmetsp:Transcript_5340/g.16344  ORF Transcript_5340/g.16344 Transcript_5340/m.16344 type:complete len:94 (-) Transcript_5340:84-365(-)|eukprot:scaffold207302_cov39-Tisochrysis_lutea.AAC.1
MSTTLGSACKGCDDFLSWAFSDETISDARSCTVRLLLLLDVIASPQHPALLVLVIGALLPTNMVYRSRILFHDLVAATSPATLALDVWSISSS